MGGASGWGEGRESGWEGHGQTTVGVGVRRTATASGALEAGQGRTWALGSSPVALGAACSLLECRSQLILTEGL